jgi:hypothetical protein
MSSAREGVETVGGDTVTLINVLEVPAEQEMEGRA